jgi:hypothetical protein
MSNSLNEEVGDIVAAVVSTSATPPVIATSSGVNAQTATPAGVVRNGKGDFTVNFPSNPCDILSRNAQVSPTNGAFICQINGGTDTSCGVLVFDAAGAAADGDFSLIITRTKTP